MSLELLIGFVCVLEYPLLYSHMHLSIDSWSGKPICVEASSSAAVEIIRVYCRDAPSLAHVMATKQDRAKVRDLFLFDLEQRVRELKKSQ